MKHFQKKISQMRKAINTIKLDIESMKSTSNFLEIKKSNSTAMLPLSIKLLEDNHLYERKRKSVFTHFRDNCPLKKDQSTKADSNTSIAMKSDMTNYSNAKQYNYQYPLNKTNKESNQYGRLYNYMNSNCYNKQKPSIINPSLKSKARNKLFNLSPETKRINTNQFTISSQRQISQYTNKIESTRKVNDGRDNHDNKLTQNYQKMNHKCYYSKNANKRNIHYDTNTNGNNDIINELVDITNKDNSNTNGTIITSNNFILYFKKILNEMKFKDEFIHKLFKMYTNSSRKDNNKRNNDLVSLYNWIHHLSQSKNANDNKNNYYNERKKKCSLANNNYQLLCEEIMKKHKLKET